MSITWTTKGLTFIALQLVIPSS